MEDYRWAVTRVLLAERMHWTLDYVDGLDWRDVQDVLTVLEHHSKGTPKPSTKGKRR